MFSFLHFFKTYFSFLLFFSQFYHIVSLFHSFFSLHFHLIPQLCGLGWHHHQCPTYILHSTKTRQIICLNFVSSVQTTLGIVIIIIIIIIYTYGLYYIFLYSLPTKDIRHKQFPLQWNKYIVTKFLRCCCCCCYSSWHYRRHFRYLTSNMHIHNIHTFVAGPGREMREWM